MELLNKLDKKKIVKIIIGESEQGSSGIHAPTKSISLIDTSVKEIHELIKEVLNKKIKEEKDESK